MTTLKELSHLPKADLIDRANRYLKSSEKATDAAFYPLRAQIFIQELARRSQNRQTRAIIGMTIAITIMTAVIMAATLWPPEVVRSTVHSFAHSLLIRASQVVDLWPWR